MMELVYGRDNIEMKQRGGRGTRGVHRLLVEFSGSDTAVIKGTDLTSAEVYNMLTELQAAGISVAGSLQADVANLIRQLHQMAKEGGKIHQ